MIEYCLGFAFDEDFQSVLLIEKQRPEWQKGLLNGIGGKVEINEMPLNAMCREFEEETGFNLDHARWATFGSLRGKDWIVYLYTTTLFDGEYSLIDYNKTDEEIILQDIDNLCTAIPNLSWLVPMAKYSLQKDEIFQINEISLH
jgi:8-oxo-dGTP diphosphatase